MMTVTVNFENPQVQLGNGTTGIEISPIIIPYSIRDAENQLQYLGGQVVLTKEDGVAFSDHTSDWYKKALVKIKDMVAASEIYTPDVTTAVDTPDVSSEADSDITPATPENNNPDVAPVAQAPDTPDVMQPTQEVATTDTTQATQEQQ